MIEAIEFAIVLGFSRLDETSVDFLLFRHSFRLQQETPSRLRQRVHSGRPAKRDFDSFLLDQSLPNQVCCFLFHAPFVAVVSEARKIIGCDDAELAQIGECLRFGLT